MQPRGEYTAESEMNRNMTAAPNDKICLKCQPKQSYSSNNFEQPLMLSPRKTAAGKGALSGRVYCRRKIDQQYGNAEGSKISTNPPEAS